MRTASEIIDLRITSRQRVVRLAFLLVYVVGGTACGQSTRDRDAGDEVASHFDELFHVVDSVTLEESQDVITVAPSVSVREDGGFVVTEMSENQVRLYSKTGVLERVLDRADSIWQPTRAIQAVDGTMYVANYRGTITIVPGGPSRPGKVYHVGLRSIVGMAVLDGESVVVAGDDSSGGPRAVLWERARAAVVRVFFSPPRNLDPGVLSTIGQLHVIARPGAIGAMLSVWDTLVVFSDAGSERSRVPIPVPWFRAPRTLPDIETDADRYEWLGQFTLLAGVHWLDGGDLIIQWMHLTAPQRARFGLLRMDGTGRLVWSVPDSPRLLAVRKGQFVFQNPTDNAPHRWVVAVLDTAFIHRVAASGPTRRAQP